MNSSWLEDQPNLRRSFLKHPPFALFASLFFVTKTSNNRLLLAKQQCVGVTFTSAALTRVTPSAQVATIKSRLVSISKMKNE